ncbi:MAG: hypothetical protein Q9196_006779 [Gyalolechia fulgens]
MDLDDHPKDKKIVFSQTGHLIKPTHLIYVPDTFRSTKIGLYRCSSKVDTLLATRYDESDLTVLKKRLGVEQADEEKFVAAWKQLGIARLSGIYRYDHLAKILLKINTDHLVDIPLIPTDSHPSSYVAASELRRKPIYLEKDLGHDHIPNGIDLRFVAMEASRSYRHKLFERLGVKPFDGAAACEEIQQVLEGLIMLCHRRGIYSGTAVNFPSRISNSRSAQVFPFGSWETLWANGSELYNTNNSLNLRSQAVTSRIRPRRARYQHEHLDGLVHRAATGSSPWCCWKGSHKRQTYSTEFRAFVQQAKGRLFSIKSWSGTGITTSHTYLSYLSLYEVEGLGH